MKTKALVWAVVFFIVVLVGVCSFADDKETYGFYRPKSTEEIYGTWINTVSGGYFPEKWIVYYWGYTEGYYKATDKDPVFKATFTIVDKWTDKEEDIWYQIYIINTLEKGGYFDLMRISKNGTVWEGVEDLIMWPTEANLKSKNIRHFTYHRQ